MCGLSVKPLIYSQLESKIVYRGPDATVKKVLDEIEFTFHRLAIMDTSRIADQPFINDKWLIVCNGEIFNFQELKEKHSYNYISHSDCEVLLPLLDKYSLPEMCSMLDGEFAFVAYDIKQKKIVAARDPIGIRPLFYGHCSDGKIAFASEAKELLHCCDNIYPFPPGHYFDGKDFAPYIELYKLDDRKHTNPNQILENIRNLFIKAVNKRLHADVPLGFLLSGGLDSSLVCAIASKTLKTPIKTFAIGLDHNPIDLGYAKQVADFLGTDHHEVIFTKADILNNLREVIWAIETWDITTIRASIPMFLLCKYIRNNSDVRAVLSGEVSDELFGYKYTDFAPSADEFQTESQKRIKELYMFDVLRADRCIAHNSLEARVPFSDAEFVRYVMNIDPELKLNKYGMGKYLLRQAFEGQEYLPKDILWREKAAFSDAVGHGLVDYLIELAEQRYTDEEFLRKSSSYVINKPPSKEALMYREIFAELFPNQEHLICSYWLPNNKWPNCNLSDPSARHLPNYGASGK